MDLKDLTALVTGASSGIGREFARQLADRGMNLALVSRSEEKLRDVAGSIRERYGGRQYIEIITIDLTGPDAPLKLFDEIREKKIHVDVLINNAGFGHIGRFEEEPYEKTFRMNMLNMATVASMCHLFIPPMLEKSRGGVINLASTAAFQPLPFMANYAATKAFVLNFSLALWREYKDRNVTITALCPGYTKTGFQDMAGIKMEWLRDKKLVDPDTVVRQAIDAFINGEPVIVPREHRDFVQFTLSKFIPLKTKLDITADMFEPDSPPSFHK